MQRHAIHGCCHAVFTDPVVDITTSEVCRGDRLCLAGLGVVGTCQISRAADGFHHHTVYDFKCIF